MGFSTKPTKEIEIEVTPMEWPAEPAPVETPEKEPAGV